MKPPPFEYARPESLSEALHLLRVEDEAKILAGGQSLIPLLNFRLAAPRLLVDINRISTLDRIELIAERLHLGALVRWRDIEKSSVVAVANPLLAEAVRHIAHYQIRNRGTVGGSCAYADPAAELPAVAVACGAEFVLQSHSGTRFIAAEDFFEGALRTALEPTEILTAIRFPPWPRNRGWGFEEIAPRRGDFALLGVATLVDADRQHGLAGARIVAFGTADGPRRLHRAEAFLVDRPLDHRAICETARLAAEEVNAQADLHASAEYRRALTAVLVERTLAGAGAGASAQ